MGRTLGLALGIAATGLFLAAMTGCGSDDDDNGSGGTGGTTGGTGGATGGMGGTGGTGGATGGTGGATGGMGGTGGATGGTGGTGGATGGTGGTGGATGGTGGGDNDNSCADATDISTTAEATGEIDPPDEADFYSFPFTEGDWVILRATTTVPTGTQLDEQPYEDILDTAVTIYDEDGNIVMASMDDAFPRYSTNTELIWRVPVTGTYCIQVQDWASWAGEDRPVDPTGKYFEYELGLYSPDPDADGNAIDTEPNNDETEAQNQAFVELEDESNTPLGIFSSANYGTLETDDDVDVFAFTLPGGTVSLSTEDFTTPIGTGGPGDSGNGSTLELGLVSISDASGAIIAQLDAQKGSEGINAPLEAGTDYLLWITRNTGTTAGDNDFYNLNNFAWNQDNPEEAETTAGANDTDADAETITLETSTTNTNLDSGYVLGFIQQTDDVDYFAFEAEAGDTVSLACGALRSGSGVIDAAFAVHDPSDAELQTETETDTSDVWWGDLTFGASLEPVEITTTGTHYLVVSAGGQSADVSGNYYRCGIHVETP